MKYQESYDYKQEGAIEVVDKRISNGLQSLDFQMNGNNIFGGY